MNLRMPFSLLALAFLVGCHEPPRKPNIILVAFDTTRADHLSCQGYPLPTTPSVDRFAARSVLFEQAMSQANETLFSFASLLSSRMPSELAPLTYTDFRLPTSVETLPGVLRRYGWQTAAFVAGGNLHHTFGFDQGFDTYEDTWNFGSFFHTMPAALRWLDARDTEEPFFLFVHGYDAHTPYIHPLVFDSLFDPGYTGIADDFELQPSLIEMIWQGRMYPQLDPKVLFAFTPGKVRFFTADLYKVLRDADPITGVPIGKRDIQHIVAHYDGGLAYADFLFGLFLAGLEERHLVDDSVIIVLGDHGEDLFEHGQVNHRVALHDANLHVPFIIHLPGGIDAGRRVQEQVNLLDLMPTLLARAGVQAPARILGRDLQGLLDGDVDWVQSSPSEGVLEMGTLRLPDRRLIVTGAAPGTPAFQEKLESGEVSWFQVKPEALLPDETEQARLAAESLRTFYLGLHPEAGEKGPGLNPALQQAMKDRGYW